METLTLITIVAYVLVTSLQFSLAIDSISVSHSITDGMTIVSKGKTFELGFFSPGNSKKRYVGIWYKNISIQTVIWVANRSSPINDSFGILTVNSTGNLVLTHHNTIVWCTTSERHAEDPVAQLLDSGNLMVRDKNEEDPEVYLWESFDYPSDTSLQGMKIGWDLRIGLNRNLTSRKSSDDPAPVELSSGIKLNNYPESYMMKGAKKYYRLGPWNVLYFGGYVQMPASPIYDYVYIFNEDEVYHTYYLKDKSVITRIVLNGTTSLYQRHVWVETERIWKILITIPVDYCDNYGHCGVYGTCIISASPVCKNV